MWWLIATIPFILFIKWFLDQTYTYWTQKGVPQGNPKWIFGDTWKSITRQQSMAEMIQMLYNYGGPKTRYSGAYQFFSPTLIIKDPDLIKQIIVKDFDLFVDRVTSMPEDFDPLWSRNLAALGGKKWRDMRTTLSPAFTSSKMKFMFSLISKSGQQFVHHFLEKNENLLKLEMRDTLSRFTTDTIANVAFGIECDSLKNRHNEFYLMGNEATDTSTFWKRFKLFALFILPGFYRVFKISFFSKTVSDFFIRLVSANIESRQKQGIVRPDMVHILLDAKKKGFKSNELEPIPNCSEISDLDIAAQAALFFFAGFDALSNLLCFVSYELAVNPEIQEKLFEEISTIDGTVTYEGVLGLKFLDMVISETLRKWPSAVAIDRVCTKAYRIEPKNLDEQPLDLKPNDVVWFPIFAIHRDPQYWPEPDRFDPERFSEENKIKIQPYSYLPFGAGPRNCIGSRFALLATKTLLFYLLKNFQIVPLEKTQIPLIICKKQFHLTSENGFWLGLKQRL